MDLERYKGVFAAAPTPFFADGTVDVETAGEMVDVYVEGGLSGIFALSSTGEYFAMPQAERERMAEAVVCAAAGRVPVMTMVSDACLSVVESNIQIMAERGVDAVVLTAPYYYKYSQQELERFFVRAADMSPVPLLVYNQPTRLPSGLSEELVVQLADHPNIIGLKDTSNDAARLGRLAAALAKREDFLYYAGSESLAAYAALLKVNYVYALACVEPQLFVRMQAMARSGDVAGVLEAQGRVERLCELFRVMGGGSAESFSNFAAAIKAAMEVKGLGRAYTAQMGRLPSEEEYRKVHMILERTT